MVKRTNKTATARALKNKIEVEETESSLMQEYKKLNAQCDIILAQIYQRKQLKQV